MKYPIIRLDDVCSQIELLGRLYDYGYSFIGEPLGRAVQVWENANFQPYMYVTDIGAIWTLADDTYYNLHSANQINHILVNSPAHFLTLVRRLAHKA